MAPRTSACPGFIKFSDKCRNQTIPVAGINCLYRLRQQLAARITFPCFSVILDHKGNGALIVNYVRLRIVNNILNVSVCYPFHGASARGGAGQIWNVPNPTNQYNLRILTTSAGHLLRSYCVSLRPCNPLPISPEDCIPTLPCCRRSVICRYQFPAVKIISQSFHGRYESFVVLSGSFFYWVPCLV